MESVLKLGGIPIRFSTDDPDIEFRTDSQDNHFATGDEPEISVAIQSGPIPVNSPGKIVFDSDGAWDLCKNKEKWIVRVGKRESNNTLEKLAVFEPDFKSGILYLGAPTPPSRDIINYFLGYPIGHILLSSFLFLNHGGVLHSCGVNDRGDGILFVGASGRGKSTMASLWKDKKGVNLLSDERMSLRKTGENGFQIYGHPRYAFKTDLLSSPGSAQLKKIFFLQQGEKNAVYSIKKHKALMNLLTNAFPPVWLPKGMRSFLSVFDEIVKQVPCSIFSFVPDRSAVDFLRNSE